MRIELDDLTTPHPIGERLPAVYQDDEFTLGFTAALDAVLAPVFVTLDCFTAYLDPRLAPADFVDWLAGWVALDHDEDRTEQQRRDLVAGALELHRWRGTRRGIEEHVRRLTGGEVEVLDSGGSAAADRPSAPLPGSPTPSVVVRVLVDDPAAVDRAQLLAVVGDVVPAHVRVDVEIGRR